MHATFAQIGSGLVVVDHESRFGTLFHGKRIPQRVLENGDALRLGDTWLVFLLDPGGEYAPLASVLRQDGTSPGPTAPPARFSEESDETRSPTGDPTAMVKLTSPAGVVATSVASPVFIGNHGLCNMRLERGSTGRFHAVVSWDSETAPGGGGPTGTGGVFVEDLHSGHGTLHNGEPVRRAQLHDGDTLEVGGHRISVALKGDVCRQSEALGHAVIAPGGLAITCIEGPAAGATYALSEARDEVVLGKGDACDFALECDEVSRRHAAICWTSAKGTDGHYRPVLAVRDMGSTNGTPLRGKRLPAWQDARVGPGDVIRLSEGTDHCDLLVHYGLR